MIVMPYRVRGNTVEVSRAKGWVELKTHRNPELARKHFRALKANVRHTTPKKRKS
jgi:hypothetical protein